MPDYAYRAKDGPEKIVEGVIEANTETSAIDKVNRLGYVPIQVHLARDAGRSRFEIFPWFSGRHRKQRVIFLSRYLASFLRSGIPVLRALQILIKQESDAAFRQMLTTMEAQVKAGKRLSQSFESFPQYFSPVFQATIRAGETGGTLPASLVKMADFLKKQEAVASQIRQAMTYPMLLGLAGLGTVYYVISFVVPKLTAVFETMGQSLPLPTQIVVRLGYFMNAYWLGVLAVFVVVLLAIREFFGRSLGRVLLDHIKLRTPLLGDFEFMVSFSRFSRTLEMSLASGIPFLEALRLAIPTMDNSLLKNAMDRCYKQVEKGDGFGRRLRQETLVPAFVADLIQVGEETGKLGDVLNEISETYEKDTDDQLHLVTSLLEPAMILVVGSVIGFIVIAMLLPIFEMNVIVS